MFTQWPCWGSRSFGMWQCAAGWVVPNTPNEHCAFIFKQQVVFLEWWILEDEGTIFLHNIENYSTNDMLSQPRRPDFSYLYWLLKKHLTKILIIIIIIGIQPLGWSGQRPEFSQVTGMALVRCILVKFLGVACHCFPPLFRYSYFSPPDASTSTTTWEIPSGGSGNCGRGCCPVILLKWQLPRHLGIFYMPQIYDRGPTALLPFRRKVCWGFFRP